MNLFQKQETKLNSGKVSDFKIECDALSDEDIDCIAYLISKMARFRGVIGVPTGGLRIATAVDKYSEIENESLPILIVDDVLTTGGSMERLKLDCEKYYSEIIGVVLFARGECPVWVKPLFEMNRSVNSR